PRLDVNFCSASIFLLSQRALFDGHEVLPCFIASPTYVFVIFGDTSYLPRLPRWARCIVYISSHYHGINTGVSPGATIFPESLSPLSPLRRPNRTPSKNFLSYAMAPSDLGSESISPRKDTGETSVGTNTPQDGAGSSELAGGSQPQVSQ